MLAEALYLSPNEMADVAEIVGWASEKPRAAFALSLVAGVLILLGGVVGAIVGAIGGAMVERIPGFEFRGTTIFRDLVGLILRIIVILGALELAFGIVVIVGAVMINSGEPGKVRTGSIMVLVFSALSRAVGLTGGFTIGFILGLVGGILGLIWEPRTAGQVRET